MDGTGSHESPLSMQRSLPSKRRYPYHQRTRNREKAKGTVNPFKAGCSVWRSVRYVTCHDMHDIVRLSVNDLTMTIARRGMSNIVIVLGVARSVKEAVRNELV